MCLSLNINYLVATRTENDDIFHDESGVHILNMNAIKLS